jgi:hypothetical protein
LILGTDLAKHNDWCLPPKLLYVVLPSVITTRNVGVGAQSDNVRANNRAIGGKGATALCDNAKKAVYLLNQHTASTNGVACGLL